MRSILNVNVGTGWATKDIYKEEHDTKQISKWNYPKSEMNISYFSCMLLKKDLGWDFF